MALSFSIYIIVFYRTSIRPVRQLVQKMKDVEAGNLLVTSDVAGPKEIKNLNETFNNMMANINNLIVELNQKEKERSIEEIRALQAQINPHFIYNTLNTIKLMAMMTKAESIQHMLDAFMKVIELTYKSEGTLLSLTEEVAYLDAYLHIMKVRYGSFFEVSYNLHPQVLHCKLMKMLLQPFVENAVVHGLQAKQDGHISISAYADQACLIVEIKDNGVGMEPQQLTNLFKTHPDHLNHIGIANVKRRIELTYGGPYTVKVESVADVYTKISVILPMIFEEDQHV